MDGVLHWLAPIAMALAFYSRGLVHDQLDDVGSREHSFARRAFAVAVLTTVAACGWDMWNWSRLSSLVRVHHTVALLISAICFAGWAWGGRSGRQE